MRRLSGEADAVSRRVVVGWFPNLHRNLILNPNLFPCFDRAAREQDEDYDWDSDSKTGYGSHPILAGENSSRWFHSPSPPSGIIGNCGSCIAMFLSRCRPSISPRLLHLAEKIDREGQRCDGDEHAKNLHCEIQVRSRASAVAFGTTICIVWKDPITFFAAYEFQRSDTVPTPVCAVKTRHAQSAWRPRFPRRNRGYVCCSMAATAHA